MDKIRLLIADDHAVVRTGLATLLDSTGGIDVVGEAENGEIAVAKALKLKPDVVVMDILMPVKNGIVATREIKTALPKTKVLILTTSTVPAEISQALDAGACGAISKSANNDALVEAIKAIARGQRIISPEIADLLDDNSDSYDLTDRQLEIMRLVAKGLPNTDIASLTGVSPNTVKKHLEAIFKKLGAFNRSEAVAIALRENLLKI